MILDSKGNPTLNKCQGWRCGKGTTPPHQFCKECAADVPYHLLQAIKMECEFLAKRKVGGADHLLQMLIQIAATRMLQVRCEKDPAVLAEVRKEQEERLAQIKAEASGLVVPRSSLGEGMKP